MLWIEVQKNFTAGSAELILVSSLKHLANFREVMGTEIVRRYPKDLDDFLRSQVGHLASLYFYIYLYIFIIFMYIYDIYIYLYILYILNIYTYIYYYPFGRRKDQKNLFSLDVFP